MPLALYIHIPFCQRKCPYCDFNTYGGLERLYEPLAASLVTEITAAGAARARPAVSTIFIGGGTPTVLPADLLAEVLTTCRHAFAVHEDAEITCEANPGTVDASRFAALRQMGVNRLSMGVQSFDPAELRFLGRIHSASEAVEAFHAARAAGFANINLDFIYGLPDQSPAAWRNTLAKALALAPEHISLYALTVEEGTPFGDWAAAGRLAYPSPDLAADLYEIADEMLASADYVQYEISNWAREEGSEGKKGKEGNQRPSLPSFPSFPSFPSSVPFLACRHNLTYWRNEAYLGLGPGAHSAEGGQRWAVLRSVPEYIERVQRGESAVDFVEEIDDRLAMGETMMLGLRLVGEGVAFERFAERHGRSLQDAFGAEIKRLEGLGLLERLPDRVRLTKQARLVGNQVFAAFLP
jgi:oxygen-independent coproporphyrinogen-3 oxidase